MGSSSASCQSQRSPSIRSSWRPSNSEDTIKSFMAILYTKQFRATWPLLVGLMRYCSSITSGRSNLLVCIYFKLIANVHVTTNGWKTSVTFGTGNGHDVDNEDLPEDNDADGELLNVSALRTGLHQMQNCTGILQRIIRGGGEVWGADPGVIEMITTQPATMLPGMHNTQREAERAGRAAGGRRVSNGLYSKLLLTDLRTNEMDFENRRRLMETPLICKRYMLICPRMKREAHLIKLRGYSIFPMMVIYRTLS